MDGGHLAAHIDRDLIAAHMDIASGYDLSTVRLMDFDFRQQVVGQKIGTAVVCNMKENRSGFIIVLLQSYRFNSLVL